MIRGLLVASLAAAAILLADRPFAQEDPKDIVLKRRQLMHEALSAYWPLLDVSNGKSTDLLAAAAAARTVEQAISASVELFIEGTAMGEVPGSRAKPEVWSKAAEFEAAADELLLTVSNLEAAAEAGDLEAFKQDFDAFAAACVACHEFKPSGGGKFRFPK